MNANTFRLAIAVAVLSVTLSAAATAAAQTNDQYAALRSRMVDDAVITGGVKNERVIESMRNTPRHEFVTAEDIDKAYFDMALPIGEGQTISPPYVVAFMTEQLDPQPTDKVLEIGTGSGYQAAVLSPLVKEVYSIEIQEPLGKNAAKVLERLKYENVHTMIGDGYKGWPEHAPFDKIIVTCSPQNVPQPLIDQLADGGRIVVPLGERFQQTMYLFVKKEGKLEREALHSTFFVPMTGRAEELRDLSADSLRPNVVNGGFEKIHATTGKPEGWYYVRQAAITDDHRPPSGQKCITFNNTTAGRPAQALQAFGIDGRLVRRLDVSCWVRGENLEQGEDQKQQPHILIEFYGEDRAPVGHDGVGPWNGTFNWTRQRSRIQVPSEARLAVIGVGMFGATGELSLDDVRISRAP